MKMKIIFLIQGLIALMSTTCFALIEVRTNFAGAFVEPRDFNHYLTSQNVKEDWQIINEIAHAAGINLGFSNLQDLRFEMTKSRDVFANLHHINKAKWLKSVDSNPADLAEKITAQNFDYYLTNSLARASRILNKCSNDLN
jgi:NADH dehydrogenase/NADH:ubiquinone oxidoreductase subunit G